YPVRIQTGQDLHLDRLYSSILGTDKPLQMFPIRGDRFFIVRWRRDIALPERAPALDRSVYLAKQELVDPGDHLRGQVPLRVERLRAGQRLGMSGRAGQEQRKGEKSRKTTRHRRLLGGAEVGSFSITCR